ncbi:hypothetical protein AB0F18_16385 [Streptomyces sp. NPDC029216]|uniref:hypothetical protein n=1 Tax=Streptomyces sp. NPDC029216 TaxID=3154701 RepID=UPI003409B7FD
MGGMQDKRQKPGKGREEQERISRPGQDPVHPGAGQENIRGKSPEELKRHGRDDMRHGRDEDDMRDEEL